MDKDIIDILQRLQREGKERMRKNIIARDNSKELIVNPYNRVMRENIAAKAVYKTVDYIHKIYHNNISQEEIDKLFNDLFYVTMDLLESKDYE